MCEVSPDAAPEATPGRPPPPSCLLITDISQWVERYALMAAIIATRFPHKAPELFGYLITIVRAERNYEAGRWVLYDRQLHWRALARKDLNWSVMDVELFNEAFVGRVKSIPRCSICLRDDHLANGCPQNVDRQWLALLPAAGQWQLPPALPVSPAPVPHTSRPERRREVCNRYNEGRCRLPSCKYTHQCKACGGDHPRISCTVQGQGQARCRSPRRPLPPQGPSSGWSRR